MGLEDRDYRKEDSARRLSGEVNIPPEPRVYCPKCGYCYTIAACDECPKCGNYYNGPRERITDWTRLAAIEKVCPNCDSADIIPPVARGWLRRLLVGANSWKCRKCHTYFSSPKVVKK